MSSMIDGQGEKTESVKIKINVFNCTSIICIAVIEGIWERQRDGPVSWRQVTKTEGRDQSPGVRRCTDVNEQSDTLQEARGSECHRKSGEESRPTGRFRDLHHSG